MGTGSFIPIMPAAATIRTRKYMTNRLLKRKQMVIDIVHHDLPNVSRKDLQSKLAGMYKVKDENCVLVDGLRTAYGGGRSTGFAYIYDDLAAAKRYAAQHVGARHGIRDPLQHKGRKMRREKKNRDKKFRGVKKTKRVRPGKD